MMLSFLLLLLISIPPYFSAQAQPPAAVPIPLSASDAVLIAKQDAFNLPIIDRVFMRYLYAPLPCEHTTMALGLTLNSVQSTSGGIYRPNQVLPHQLWRVDLRYLAPLKKDFDRLFFLWEDLAVIDPYLHTLHEKVKPGAAPRQQQTVRQAIRAPTIPPLASVGLDRATKDFVLAQQKTRLQGAASPQSQAERQRSNQARLDQQKLVAELALHTGIADHQALADLVNSDAPLLRADWFIEKSLTTLDGGLYYVFRGYITNVAGKTDKQLWLERAGASEATVQGLKADERAAMFFSGVTSRQRRIDVFFGSGVRPSSGLPLVTITHDISSAGNDPAQDPLLNLIEFRDVAEEAIQVTRNGMLEYALFDGNGALQDVVPPDIAHDSTIPFPYDNQLQPAASCIRCHFSAGSDGFIPFKNDVAAMLSPQYRRGIALDIFDDLDPSVQKTKSNIEALDRLAGLYAGNLEPTLKQGRNGHCTVVGLSIGQPSADACKHAGESVAKVIAAYRYSLVTPLRACIEIGIPATEATAVDSLNLAIPLLPIGLAGFPPEGGVLGALKAGIHVQVKQWELNFGDAALRRRTVLIRAGRAGL